MKILVLDGANKNTLAIVRHLGKLRTGQIDVVSYSKFSISFYSKYVSSKVLLPHPQKRKEAFVQELLSHLQNENYDLLIPVGFRTFQICAEWQDEIKKCTELVITSYDNIRLCSNKIETYKLAEQLGVPYPKTFYVEKEDLIYELDVEFPVVIKAPVEAGSTIVDFANNPGELRSKFLRMCGRHDFGGLLPILQEYIDGAGYGFFAYYEFGTCKRIFMHRRIREYPVSGGASVCAESCRHEELVRQGMKLLDHLQWHGVAMVEFKRDSRDGLFKLMEINPKFWGSLDLAICAGANFPYYLVQHALNQQVAYSDAFERLTFQWILNGELFHFFKNPKALPMILKSLRHSKNDIWLADFKPNLFQILLILEHLYKKIAR